MNASSSRQASIGISGRPGCGAEHLLGEPVQVTERVGAHQHQYHLQLLISDVGYTSYDL